MVTLLYCSLTGILGVAGSSFGNTATIDCATDKLATQTTATESKATAENVVYPNREKNNQSTSEIKQKETDICDCECEGERHAMTIIGYYDYTVSYIKMNTGKKVTATTRFYVVNDGYKFAESSDERVQYINAAYLEGITRIL